MLLAMCLGPEVLIYMVLILLVAVGVAAACVAAAIYATIGLAKWAAARHNRMVANAS